MNTTQFIFFFFVLQMNISSSISNMEKRGLLRTLQSTESIQKQSEDLQIKERSDLAKSFGFMNQRGNEQIELSLGRKLYFPKRRILLHKINERTLESDESRQSELLQIKQRSDLVKSYGFNTRGNEQIELSLGRKQYFPNNRILLQEDNKTQNKNHRILSILNPRDLIESVNIDLGRDIKLNRVLATENRLTAINSGINADQGGEQIEASLGRELHFPVRRLLSENLDIKKNKETK